MNMGRGGKVNLIIVGFQHIDKINVELIGRADKSQKEGVILASFNAG